MTQSTRGVRHRRAVMLLVAVVIGVLATVLLRYTATTDVTGSAPVGTSMSGSPVTPVRGAPGSIDGAADVLRDLHGLTVLPDRPDVPGYQRGCGPGQRCSFGPAWTDDSTAPDGHNGCGTRSDVLREQLRDVLFADGSRCVVVAGVLHDPYTGGVVAFRKADAAAVQIDHVYPLARAFDMGAAQWTQEQRTIFANDTALELLAVDGKVNQSKGDSGPAEWMPPDATAGCAYVQRYVAIAAAYRLAITAAELDSMTSTLAGCG